MALRDGFYLCPKCNASYTDARNICLLVLAISLVVSTISTRDIAAGHSAGAFTGALGVAVPVMLAALITWQLFWKRSFTVQLRLQRKYKRQQTQSYARSAEVPTYVCTYLGGYGADELTVGDEYFLSFAKDLVTARATQGNVNVWQANSDDLAVEVDGKGKYQTGGGVFGGGFGVRGAIKGAAIAEIINVLTTRERVDTVIRLVTKSATLYFGHGVRTPEELRIELARWSGAPRSGTEPAHGGSVAQQLVVLADLHAKGELSDDEYAKAKSNVLRPPPTEPQTVD
jgi:hypothetical protein